MAYGFGGGFGGGNMQQLMRQAQKIQQQMQQAREELNAEEFTGSSGGGMVEVTMLGNKTLKSVKIKKEVVDPDDIEMLEDLIISAVNEAFRKMEEDQSSSMAKITGGLGMGGGFPF